MKPRPDWAKTGPGWGDPSPEAGGQNAPGMKPNSQPGSPTPGQEANVGSREYVFSARGADSQPGMPYSAPAMAGPAQNGPGGFSLAGTPAKGRCARLDGIWRCARLD